MSMALKTHFCKFNMAHRVNKGHYGDVALDGVKFWVSGDLGENFGDGEADWAVVTFEPSVTEQQREVVKIALGQVYPVTWKSFSVAADAPLTGVPARVRRKRASTGGT